MDLWSLIGRYVCLLCLLSDKYSLIPQGTWQFRSALSLAFPRKPYRLSDDIESFIHTYRWLVLRFHGTNISDLRTYVQSEYESSSKTVITGVRVGGRAKLHSFTSSSSPFQVTDNVDLQALLDEIASNCFKHYQLVDKKLMEALYGVPVESSQKTHQLPPAPTVIEPLDDVNEIFGFEDEIAPVAEPVPVLPDPQQSAQPAADPCDVDGFLSQHVSLVKLFRKWKVNTARRQDDQFVLRFNDEPLDLVLTVGSRGIGVMSRTLTVDSTKAAVSSTTSQNAPAEPDTSSAPSSSRVQRQKRRQSEDTHANNAAPKADSSGGLPSKTQVVKKRQKKTQ